jgi:3-methyladenine DNA glycosylase AlkD
MKTSEILEKLQKAGSEQIKKILMKHGAKEPVFGVKVEDLKKILKGEKGNNQLAMELFNTGNYDAMYLAGLMADGAQMTAAEINRWAETAYGSGISEYTVPWVTSENKEGYSLAKKWIESASETVAVTGWCAFSNILSVWPDEVLDKDHLRSLLDRVGRDIHQSKNRVRYAMNGFIICAGSYVPGLKDHALSIAVKIGPVKVEMNGTACKVPLAADYIIKVNKLGRTGQKKKTAKC